MRGLWSCLLLCPVPALAGDYFYGDAAGTVVEIATVDGALELDGSQRVWRTGDVLIRATADAVDAVEAMPGVAYLETVHAERGVYKVVSTYGVDEIALSRWIYDVEGVLWSTPDFEVELVPHTLDDPLIEQAWHLDNQGQRGGLPGADSGAFGAWTVATGAGIVIAIIDTGIDPAHPDLDLVPGYDFGDNDDDVTPEPDQDGYGHGTAMAGVASAIGNNGVGVAGIAPDALTMPIKVIGDRAPQSAIYQSFVFAVDNGASVLSNSWGYNTTDCPPITLTAVLADAFDYAATEGRGGLGAAIPMSLGNDGCDSSRDQMHAHPAITSVGAISDVDRKIGYSNFGEQLDIMGFAGGDGRPGLWTTDIQGELGYNDGDNADYWGGGSGTSSACASIAGVYALMFEANPRLTAADAKEVLCATAVKPAWEDADWDANGWSPRYGCGRADAEAAVLAVANGVPSVSLDVPGDQPSDRIRLSWTGADPDGDALGYRVIVRLGDRPDPEFDELLTQTQVVLDDLLVAGGTYDWSVVPIDAWGEGETVVGEPFAVVVPPEEPKGACSTVQGTAAFPVWLAMIGLLGLRRRQ